MNRAGSYRFNEQHLQFTIYQLKILLISVKKKRKEKTFSQAQFALEIRVFTLFLDPRGICTLSLFLCSYTQQHTYKI